MKKLSTFLFLLLCAAGTSQLYAQGALQPDPNYNYSDFSTLQQKALIYDSKFYSTDYINYTLYATLTNEQNDISEVRNNAASLVFSNNGGGITASYTPFENNIRVGNVSYAQQIDDNFYIYGFLEMKGGSPTTLIPTVPRIVLGTDHYATFTYYNHDEDGALGIAMKPFSDDRIGIAVNAKMMQSDVMNGSFVGQQYFNAYAFGADLHASFTTRDEDNNGGLYSINLNNVGFTAFHYAVDNKRYMPTLLDATAQYQLLLPSADQIVFGGMLGKELTPGIPNPNNQHAVNQYNSYGTLGSLLHPNNVFATSINVGYVWNWQHSSSIGFHTSYTQAGPYSIPVAGFTYRIQNFTVSISDSFHNGNIPEIQLAKFNVGLHFNFGDIRNWGH